jgi:hypothetical protein
VVFQPKLLREGIFVEDYPIIHYIQAYDLEWSMLMRIIPNEDIHERIVDMNDSEVEKAKCPLTISGPNEGDWESGFGK